MSDAVFKLLLHSERIKALAETEDCVPLTVEIDPTNTCSHNCQFCSTRSELKVNRDSLPIDLIVNLLHDLKNQDVRSINWKGGGEPTLYPRLGEVIEEADKLGFAQGLTTNGSLLFRWHELAARTLDWIRVSLDAARPKTHLLIHGSEDFTRIVKHIGEYAKLPRKGRIGLNMNLTLDNYQEAQEFVLLGMRLGVDYVAIRPAYYECFGYENPLTEATATMLNEQLQKAKQMETSNLQVYVGQVANAGRPGTYVGQVCLAPALRAIVGADANVYACCDLRGYPEFSFGSLRKNTFWEIWYGDKRREVLAKTKAKECLAYCSRAFDWYSRAIDYLRDSNKIDPDFM